MFNIHWHRKMAGGGGVVGFKISPKTLKTDKMLREIPDV